MQNNKKQQVIENVIYATLWLLVLLVVIFLSQKNNQIQWAKVLHDSIALLPFFLVFMANNILLTPKLLFKKRYVWYFTATTVLIVFVSHPTVSMYLQDLLNMHGGVMSPPLPHPQTGLTPPAGPPQGMNLEQLRPGMEPLAKGHFIQYMNNMLISILVVGFNLAIKQTGRLMKEERMRNLLNEEKLQTELSFLRHQISPHFLMNTLNNIHALVDIEPKLAQSSIVRLSHMLRYLLYEKEDKKTTLAKEIEFIKSYSTLMQMRYTDDLDIQLHFPEEIPNVSIPPFVFITILENAFKHGAVANKNCFIHLNIGITGRYLVCTCSNCKQNSSKPKTPDHGIGLENTRKRLELYYGKDYIWEIEETHHKYTSTLKLPIYDH